MNPRLLLEQASAVLDGTVHIPPGQRTRAAALLARQALEDVVRDHCAKLGVPMPRAKTRSRLIVLRVLGPPEVSEPARAAWEGLSRSCHRHAYELTPGEAEIRALIQLVAGASTN